MQYQYRWLYVVIMTSSIFFMGYIYDIKPIYHDLFVLRNHHQQLLGELTLYRQRQNKPFYPFTQDVVMGDTHTKKAIQHSVDVLAALSTIEHQSGVRIRSLNQSHQLFHHANMRRLHLIIRGRFTQIYSFIRLLSAYPIFILDFNYQPLQSDYYSLVLNLLIIQSKFFYGGNLTRLNQDATHNLFCTTSHLFDSNYFYDVSMLQFIPIDQLKMVGYMQQGVQHRALVSTENRAVFSLNEGDRIGIERGVVQKILPSRIIFLLAHQRQIILKMEQSARD